MRVRFVKALAVFALVAALISAFLIPASAMDNTYSFDEFGMSMKLPKSYYVITRDTPRGDEVFTKVGLDYDETMTAFRNADIYLRAYDPDKVIQLSMTVTKDENSRTVNNYSDLTAADRKAITDMMLSDPSVESAVEVKHNGNIFFETERSTVSEGKTVYFDQSSTVINGMQIDLTLQKSEKEIAADEAKILTNAANSLSFKEIKRNTGAVFEWWRLLLWIGILVAISVAVSVIYKHRDASNKRKLEDRRARRSRAASAAAEIVDEQPAAPESFDKDLGYTDEEEFSQRSETDEMASHDISVIEKDPAKGVSYFEDEGDSIDDGTDYFDTYFSEPTEQRSPILRFFSNIGTYLMIAFKHIGYFFRNLFNMIFGKNNKK